MATLPANMVGKQDKKGEKRDMEKAAVARNQLFGEAQKAAAAKRNDGENLRQILKSAKESQTSKHTREIARS